MTARLEQLHLLHSDEVVAPPVLPLSRSCEDHNFELPNGIYAAMALGFGGFIAVLAATFSGNMGLSYAVIGAFLVAFFAVPVLLVHNSPSESRKALSWDNFLEKGIGTATGRTRPGEAAILVLTLPALIFGWAVAVAIIASIVS